MTYSTSPGDHADPDLLVAAAHAYIARGLYVFPLTPGSKRPLPGSHGLKDASNDPEQIDAWWAATPTANIGIRTGDVYDCIDVDGREGIDSLLGVSELPVPVAIAKTARPDGWHLWVPTEVDRHNAAGMLPGVDYRGQGGYCVAPPSVISAPDAKHHGSYAWLLRFPPAASTQHC